MRASRPAAGAAHAALHLGEGFLDANVARLRFFSRGNPAYPLVARERRNVFP